MVCAKCNFWKICLFVAGNMMKYAFIADNKGLAQHQQSISAVASNGVCHTCKQLPHFSPTNNLAMSQNHQRLFSSNAQGIALHYSTASTQVTVSREQIFSILTIPSFPPHLSLCTFTEVHSILLLNFQGAAGPTVLRLFMDSLVQSRTKL